MSKQTIDLKAIGGITKRIEEIATSFGVIKLVIPNDTFTHFMDFDREACKTGLKTFCRPRMESDNYCGFETGQFFSKSHIMVTEITEGIRSRRELDIRAFRMGGT